MNLERHPNKKQREKSQWGKLQQKLKDIKKEESANMQKSRNLVFFGNIGRRSNFHTQKWRNAAYSEMTKFTGQYILNVLCFKDLNEIF